MAVVHENTLAEIVNQNFRAASLFEKYGLDFCCGGKKPLQQACVEKNIPLPEIIQKLELLMQQPARASQDFGTMSLAQLMDHIVEKHHRYIKASLEMISYHTQKVARVHGRSYSYLIEIAELFEKIKQDFPPHLELEEKILFPAIQALVEGKRPAQDLPMLLESLQTDHQVAGKVFGRIRELTGDYQPPLSACNTWKVSYAELQEFEKDLHQHVHLENNLLYPKALEVFNQI